MHLFPQGRVANDQGSGVQGDGIVSEKLQRSVAAVTKDRETVVGELHPDLVMAAGFQGNFHQADAAVVAQTPVAEASFLAGGGSNLARKKSLSLQPIAPTFLIRDLPGYLRPVDFLRAVTTEFRGQSPCRLGGARQDDDTGRLTIQAMHQTEEDPTRFGVFILQPPSGFLEQTLAPGVIALYQLPGRLVDHQQVVIFIDDLH